jgi:hypothetical protein
MDYTLLFLSHTSLDEAATETQYVHKACAVVLSHVSIVRRVLCWVLVLCQPPVEPAAASGSGFAGCMSACDHEKAACVFQLISSPWQLLAVGMILS